MTLETGSVYFSGQNHELVLPETVSIFGFSVSFYGIFLVLAAVIGVSVALREGKKRRLKNEWLFSALSLSIVFGVLGARIYYVMFQWHPFIKSPLTALNLRSGGLAYFGALLGIWMVIRIFCKRKQESFEKTADALCIGASYAAIPVWLGCVFAREPIGRFSEGAFSVRLGTQYLPREADCSGMRELWSHVIVIEGESYISMHPVALYGIVAGVVIAVLLAIAKRVLKKDGQLFWMYLFLNGIATVILEYFRASRCCIWGTEIPMNSVVAGVLVMVILISVIHKGVKKGQE